MKELNQDAFQEAVANGVTVIDFWADWCGPCRMMAPVLEKAAAELEGIAGFAKVNVDEEKELAIRYQIRSIPTLLIFKAGEVREILIGMQSKDKLVARVREIAQAD